MWYQWSNSLFLLRGFFWKNPRPTRYLKQHFDDHLDVWASMMKDTLLHDHDTHAHWMLPCHRDCVKKNACFPYMLCKNNSIQTRIIKRWWCYVLKHMCIGGLEGGEAYLYIYTRNFALASLAQVSSALRASYITEPWVTSVLKRTPDARC